MFGLQEWIIPLGILILILLFGGKRLGQIGTGLGEGIRNFRKSLKGDEPQGGGGDSQDPPKA